jgi:hypothetical protein
LFHKIIDKHGQNIEKMSFMKLAIDAQFRESKTIIIRNALVYIILFFLPFLAQMFREDKISMITLNSICLLSQLFIFMQEILSMYFMGSKRYLHDGWNLVDMSNIILYFVYFVVRLSASG